MRKTTCTCDYCGKECEPTNFVLPKLEEHGGYIIDRNEDMVYKYKEHIYDDIIEEEQDICIECQIKMASFLPLIEKLMERTDTVIDHGVLSVVFKEDE